MALPMCQSEFGAGTEYGCLCTTSPLHLNAVLIGSVALIISRILFLETLNPIDLILPHTSVCPKKADPVEADEDVLSTGYH